MLIQAHRTAAMRTSETERGRAADFLRDACADGRLSPDELDSRLDELWAGRTVDDMRRLVWDLPGGEAVLPRLSARPRPLPTPARPRRRALALSGATLLVVAAVLVAVLIALPDFVAFAAIAIVVALAMSTLLLTMLLAPVALVGVAVARLASWMFRRRWPT
jgi:hypothetical protein